MAEKKVKITEAPEKKKFSGLLLDKAKEYNFTPDVLLDKLGAPKDGRPVFTLRPYTYVERHEVEAEKSLIQSESFMWAKKNGVDIQKLDNLEFMALQQYLISKAYGSRQSEITRNCILKVNGKEFNTEIFDQFPIDLIESIGAEVKRISELKMDDFLGL